MKKKTIEYAVAVVENSFFDSGGKKNFKDLLQWINWSIRKIIKPQKQN